jgi:hypothetical protein
MSVSGKSPGAAAKDKSQPRRNGDLDEGLMESFPASDPPAAVDPTTHLGGGHVPGYGKNGPKGRGARKARGGKAG